MEIISTEYSPSGELSLIKAVLSSGNSVELPATGYSMFPSLKPGDLVLVKPMSNKEIPPKGSVVVHEENGNLIMHRLIGLRYNGFGRQSLICRGDSRVEEDEPWDSEQLLGMAVSCKRGGMDFPVRIHIPRAWQYILNKRFLWLFWKIKRVKNVFPG